MNDESHEIMTIEEVASYLRIPVSTVYRLAQQGRIPASKVGRQWRFRRQAIERWLEANSQASISPKTEFTKQTGG
jgi:excisionase family DNA binding protein